MSRSSTRLRPALVTRTHAITRSDDPPTSSVLTVPHQQSTLDAHDVRSPTAMEKVGLIELFNHRIADRKETHDSFPPILAV